MTWKIKIGYTDIYQTDNLEELITFVRNVLAPNNSYMKTGRSIEIEVVRSNWDEDSNMGEANHEN